MQNRTFFKNHLIPGLSLLVLLLASCAPAVAPTEISVQQPTITDANQPSATEVVLSVSATPEGVAAAPTEVFTVTPVPLATSRGPDLEATDPSTVSLASGGLQFVEVFHFW
ncbi:MAG: hypothetical protein R3307_05910 [Anaerolineales bacterium]|nr:hypothetical protein [Anaerolineales bacterium]